jgi:hypothetical protein
MRKLTGRAGFRAEDARLVQLMGLADLEAAGLRHTAATGAGVKERRSGSAGFRTTR